jgi:filamentous hemagglutinin family protein
MRLKRDGFLFYKRFITRAKKCLAAFLAITIGYLPPSIALDGGIVVHGQVDFKNAADRLAIIQASEKAIINWQQFDIASHEHVEFQQPSIDSIVLNRVLGAKPSEILGKLSANGQVTIINQNGIMFGETSEIDIYGLLATTADIHDENFIASNYIFDIAGKADANIANYGKIIASGDGYVALSAPKVANHGVIKAVLGKVALASGETATLDFTGDKLLEVAVSRNVTSQIISNTKTIAANQVELSQANGDAVLDSLIMVRGDLIAKTVGKKNGKIIIEGARDANVIVQADLDTANRNIGWVGGNISVTGGNVVIKDGAILDASGHSGGGQILIGGDYLGQGLLQNAKNLLVEKHTAFYNDGIKNGSGGKTIFWSDNTTTFKGNAFARGGSNYGDGGFLETSGGIKLNALGEIDLTAKNGKAGTYLMDPDTIYIVGNFAPDQSGYTTPGLYDFGSNLSLWVDPMTSPIDYGDTADTFISATGNVGENYISSDSDLTFLAPGVPISFNGVTYTVTGTSYVDDYSYVTISPNVITGGTADVYRIGVSQIDSLLGDGNNFSPSTKEPLLYYGSSAPSDPTSDFYSPTNNTYLDFSCNYGCLDPAIPLAMHIPITIQDAYFVFNNAGSAPNPYQYFLYDPDSDSGYYINTTSTNNAIIIEFNNPNSYATSAYLNGNPVNWSIDSTTFPNVSNDTFVATYYNFSGYMGEIIGYAASPPDGYARELVEQYLSLKWGSPINLSKTGAEELAYVTSGDLNYSYFSTRYLEHLAQYGDLNIQARNDIFIDFLGDTLNLTTTPASFNLTSTNVTTFSDATILVGGGNILVDASLFVTGTLTLTSTSGNVTFAYNIDATNADFCIANISVTANSITLQGGIGEDNALNNVILNSTQTLEISQSFDSNTMTFITNQSTSDILLDSRINLNGGACITSTVEPSITIVSGQNILVADSSVTLNPQYSTYWILNSADYNNPPQYLTPNFHMYGCDVLNTPTCNGNLQLTNSFVFVNQPPLNVTISNMSITYGSAVPTLAYTTSGYLTPDYTGGVPDNPPVDTLTFPNGDPYVACDSTYGQVGTQPLSCAGVTSALGYNITCTGANITVDPRDLNVSLNLTTTVSKNYDGTPTAYFNTTNFVIAPSDADSGIVCGDSVYVANITGLYTGVNGDYVGTNKPVSVSLNNTALANNTNSNYIINGTLPLTLTGNIGIITGAMDLYGSLVPAAVKYFDGSTFAYLTPQILPLPASAAYNVYLDYRNAVLNFATPYVGSNLTYTITNLSLLGSDASLFTLSNSTITATNGIIYNDPLVPRQVVSPFFNKYGD